MIKVKDALKIILSSIKPLGNEKVRLLDGLDRVLADDIHANCNLPPFDNSAMDGYAVRAKDTKGASGIRPKILKVIEDVAAGYTAKNKVCDNQAIRIMTGAPVPNGADSVIMVEFTKKDKNLVEIFKQTKKGENIRRAGEDVKKKQKVLSKGTILRPQEIGMLASLGIARINVAKRPRVGILATGDELVGVEERLTKGKIRNSNTYIVHGQILKCGATPVDLGIARDYRTKVRKKIEAGFAKRLDMLLVIGGISVGDYDLVKDVLLDMGMKMKFWKVCQRPGKPLAFGIIRGIPVFGLPGNPVSSTISFEEFVRPSLLKMQGSKNLFRPGVWAILTQDFQKKKDLRYFIRARLKNIDGKFYASITGPQGSGIINSLVLADGIIVAPEEKTFLKKGHKVYVQLLRHGFDGGAI
ncbi:MAG: molybdopterin molybdotransferase MoeA [Candidatus Omnitrophica bacterium]|nr:molybdopterin molybdotransferase MoeA [Candidatus Omnitrophota bacterium]MBU4590382.1 molybdopterin molybdotransferase MoeA [Candidatus Omnitrophota bacterium]